MDDRTYKRLFHEKPLQRRKRHNTPFASDSGQVSVTALILHRARRENGGFINPIIMSDPWPFGLGPSWEKILDEAKKLRESGTPDDQNYWIIGDA